jgi:hypothetical protein
MPCRFGGLFFVESTTTRNLAVHFLDESSSPHSLSMNYFQNDRDGDRSPFPLIYNSVVHGQVYSITGHMVHRPSKPLLVYNSFVYQLKAELDATCYGVSYTCFDIEFDAPRLFVLPSYRRRRNTAFVFSDSRDLVLFHRHCRSIYVRWKRK